MKIITSPTVELVGYQQVDDAAIARFLGAHDVEKWETDTDIAGQKLVEIAGRLCYMSFAKPRPGGNEAYIDHILEVGHGSVLEHAVYNLIITGVSRSFTHELVRHRAGFGYSQLSQRFVDESGCDFVVPPALIHEVNEAKATVKAWGCSAEALLREGRCTGNCLAGLVWLAHMERSQSDYAYLSDYLHERLMESAWCKAGGVPRQESGGKEGFFRSMSVDQKTAIRKSARESARSVLPNATETKIFVTGNARALRHFIEMRGNEFADAEIREVAIELHRVLFSHSPNLFGDYRLEDVGGQITVKTEHSKV